jgi:transposase
MVLLDNSTIHQGEPIEELRRQHPRLHIEYFPSYAPELNPDEGGLVSSEGESGQWL